MYYEMIIKNVLRLIAATRNRYGARQLNEQNIFLSMFGLVLGTVYGARRIMNDRNLIKFPAVQVSNLTFWMYVVSSHPDMTVVLQQAKRHVVKSQIATIAHSSAHFSLRVIVGNYILYLVFRRTIYWHGAHIAGLFTK